jgi:hypothetical protein
MVHGIHEIKPGVIYKDANVTVTAFPTKHAMACSGCDVLVHDAQTLDLYAKMPERLHYERKLSQRNVRAHAAANAPVESTG